MRRKDSSIRSEQKAWQILRYVGVRVCITREGMTNEIALIKFQRSLTRVRACTRALKGQSNSKMLCPIGHIRMVFRQNAFGCKEARPLKRVEKR